MEQHLWWIFTRHKSPLCMHTLDPMNRVEIPGDCFYETWQYRDKKRRHHRIMLSTFYRKLQSWQRCKFENYTCLRFFSLRCTICQLKKKIGNKFAISITMRFWWNSKKSNSYFPKKKKKTSGIGGPEILNSLFRNPQNFNKTNTSIKKTY